MGHQPDTRRGPDWLAADLGLGLLAGVSLLVVDRFRPTGLDDWDAAHPYLLALLGTGVAILGAVLAVMAIMTAFLSAQYLALLERASTGIVGALRPYRYVAAQATTLSTFSLLATALFKTLPQSVAVTVVALITGLAVWSLVGACQLVQITMNHIADQRAWTGALEAAKKQVADEVRLLDSENRDRKESNGRDDD
ncbi:hypothetical protein [Raineyella sp.]|uniref:hypothetical protein n=1 Tax=Raineyella sp. TaxID=1911550 RepID=UPI002B203B4D|nr:hypothetical protein [Raineyella sp.]MEA5055645.1 hypothetical protein [Propionicimonas sp.]MEA5154903.1 hypothetical protein [Raineyella sp.]